MDRQTDGKTDAQTDTGTDIEWSYGRIKSLGIAYFFCEMRYKNIFKGEGSRNCLEKFLKNIFRTKITSKNFLKIFSGLKLSSEIF